MIKHKLKMGLRAAWARLLFHTGMHALVDRIMPARLTILAGHRVSSGTGGAAHLPGDMTISGAKLEQIVTWFARRYRLCTVGEGARALRGAGMLRSLVALSFDDGYKDNCDVLLPILERTGGRATVFLESRPLDARKVNWSHKYFWILANLEPARFVRRYGELSSEPEVFRAAQEILRDDPGRIGYRLKRHLKYEAGPEDRELVLDQIFSELGGDERTLCDELYLTWDEVRRMQAGGIELGGHTVNHPILSRCDPSQAEREVGEGAASLRRALQGAVTSFAYPWGRPWDFDEASQRAVRIAGFDTACTMRAGVNLPRSDPMQYARLAIDDNAELHLLVAEACGGFELLRRCGLDL